MRWAILNRNWRREQWHCRVGIQYKVDRPPVQTLLQFAQRGTQMKKSKSHIRAEMQVQTLTGQLGLANQNYRLALEEVNGLKMRVEALMAKINGQAKRLEMFSRHTKILESKVQGWKEIAHELMPTEREEITGITHPAVDVVGEQ
jgi:hypothetical protein